MFSHLLRLTQQLLGTPPAQLTGPELLATWKSLITKLASHQHIMAIAAVDLPVPRPGSEEWPTKCTVISNAFTTMIREGEKCGDEQTNGVRLTPYYLVGMKR